MMLKGLPVDPGTSLMMHPLASEDVLFSRYYLKLSKTDITQALESY